MDLSCRLTKYIEVIYYKAQTYTFMIHQVPKTGIERADKNIRSRKSVTTRRAAIAFALALVGCSNDIPNPFNVQATYDATANDASDGAVQDTTPLTMDGATPDKTPMDAETSDTPDNPQMDAAAEGIAPMDASVDAPTPDVSDTSNENPTTDAPADTTNEVATVDARIEDVSADNGFDVGSDEPDAATEDTRDAQDDNGPDIEISDARDPIDTVDVTDGSDGPDVIDVPRDLSAEVGGDIGPEAGADATADAGIITRITVVSGAPTCTRVIVVGIPGCNPGDAECTYSRSSGGRVQYTAEAVTVPPSGTVNYSFYNMLSGPSPRQVFPVPNTPMATPTVSNGIYEVTMTPTIGAIPYGTCRGPFIRVVN